MPKFRERYGRGVCYATPFPKERGYVILERGNLRMLILRMEDLDRCVTPAIREFLGIPDFRLASKNIGEQKAYGQVYQDTLKVLRLPPDYVQRKHATKYARHFYTPEELNASVSRWV